MPLPQPPRGDPLDQAIIAWADSSARLAAALRNAAPARPALTLAPPPHPAVALGAAVAAYWYWARVWHCTCQWHLAVEIHPIFHPWSWCGAASASILWQLWDRLKPVTRSQLRVRRAGTLSGK